MNVLKWVFFVKMFRNSASWVPTAANDMQSLAGKCPKSPKINIQHPSQGPMFAAKATEIIKTQPTSWCIVRRVHVSIFPHLLVLLSQSSNHRSRRRRGSSRSSSDRNINHGRCCGCYCSCCCHFLCCSLSLSLSHGLESIMPRRSKTSCRYSTQRNHHRPKDTAHDRPRKVELPLLLLVVLLHISVLLPLLLLAAASAVSSPPLLLLPLLRRWRRGG